MTASAQPSSSPTVAGFIASGKAGRTSHSAQDDAEAVEPSVAGFFNDNSARPNQPPADDHTGQDNEASLNKFLELLAKIYGIPQISAEFADKLKDFELDPAQGPQTGDDGVLYAKVDNATVKITRESVTTSSPMTPALAYKMAIAAAANPNNTALKLTGTPEERILLLFAAKQMNLQIQSDSIPPLENVGPLAALFHAFEQEAGLDHSVVSEYMDQPDRRGRANPQPGPNPQPA